MKKLISLCAGFLLIIPCQAEIIIVDPNGSGDFTSIQAAIDYSWNGDTIIVRTGTYDQKINFKGRIITVTSLDPNNANIVDATVIYPSSSSGCSVTFDFGEGSNSILTGFTIKGRSICCYASSPTISKNILTSISSATQSASIFGSEGASPTISKNTILSTYGIKYCHGTIIHNRLSSITFESILNCNGLIANNVITGCTHSALFDCDGTVVNNTIVNNNNAGLINCDATVRNNIIAYNGTGIWSPCTNSYNNIWANGNNFKNGAAAGIGDISVEPLFVSDSDYHLKSHAGRWDVDSSSWVIDDVNSRCIDAGNPSDSVGVEPNPNGGRINMGAYGGTAEASKSPTGIVEHVCTKYPTMDFNKDCKVNFEDFALFTQSWLECNLDPPEACLE